MSRAFAQPRGYDTGSIHVTETILGYCSNSGVGSSDGIQIQNSSQKMVSDDSLRQPPCPRDFGPMYTVHPTTQNSDDGQHSSLFEPFRSVIIPITSNRECHVLHHSQMYRKLVTNTSTDRTPNGSCGSILGYCCGIPYDPNHYIRSRGTSYHAVAMGSAKWYKPELNRKQGCVL
ncbi:hypothetical protein P691DRAFT_788322 [Macrolepiota fuliginosa MF-IS2]|uniref:Uncharacterized protein n=1 Tax=Macrolepiota fuliginosa MF-IS2 TaxID=1400762 RepID=A0A9P5X4T5_9AGAR|nr:hypothetical protein P691DRAFT_788322 [Macrolepiota fuliginosa MF-IS2]